jgi:hypothetical protein
LKKDLLSNIIEVTKQFLPIIGVILGFLLATFKETLQNKPKIKMTLKKGSLNYYIDGIDELGQYFERPTANENDANKIKMSLKIDLYNYGKGNTAIKDVLFNINNQGNFSLNLDPNLKINHNDNQDYSFNLPASSIVTMNLDLSVNREENTEFLFVENSIRSNKNDKKRLHIYVNVTDIRNKKFKLLIEPFAIHGAI